MSKKKYVPQGTYLACDKGTVPQEFKITNNNNSFLFEEPIANTGDMAPSLNVMPFGTCSVTGNACAPAPVMWQGFEDGIFIGNFNPLLEDSVLPCGVGGKIEIFYSLEEADAACAEEPGGFWSTLAKVALVVAAVALIVVTGGMAIAAIGAIAAASGALATTVAVTVAVLEVGGCLLTAKALYDYSQDGDEEAMFKEVALGFLFLGAGKVIEKGFRAWRAARAAKVVDEVAEVTDDALRAGDDGLKAIDTQPSTKAKSWQGKPPYSGVDNWKDITLTKGKKIVGGVPGQSEYYTTMSGFGRSNGEKVKLWKGLQVKPHPEFGYRKQVAIYEVIDDTPAAFGSTSANPQFGEGGLPQIFVPEYSNNLQLIEIIDLL